MKSRKIDIIPAKNFKLKKDSNFFIQFYFAFVISLFFFLFNLFLLFLLKAPEPYIYLIIFLTWVIYFFSIFLFKRIEKSFKNKRYNKNYKILKSFDWNKYYINNSIDEIEVFKVNLDTFYIPIKSLLKKRDSEFEDINSSFPYIMEDVKIINKFKINNSIKFKFKNQIIKISYDDLFLDENTNKIYCKIKVEFFDINIDQINFNNFSEFYAKKGTYKMEINEKVIKFTLYKVIDRYNDLENFSDTENSKSELVDTVSIIPGLFGMRKMSNKKVNSKMENIVKKDCFNLINFSF